MLLDKPMTAEAILEAYASNKNRWDGWERNQIDFKVGPATAELHSAYDAFRTVYSVRVKEKRRGQGHGRRLMDVIVAYADATGTGLNLSVYADNEPAIRLYKSVGFRITHTNDKHSSLPMGPTSTVHWMTRYPTRVPSTPEWDKHFAAKALRLERDHEPRLGSDEGVEALDAFHAAQKVAYERDEARRCGCDRETKCPSWCCPNAGGRARYTGSANYEENTRRLYCDDILAAMRESGWTITRTEAQGGQQ